MLRGKWSLTCWPKQSGRNLLFLVMQYSRLGQCWLRQWLTGWQHQAITRINIDCIVEVLCHSPETDVMSTTFTGLKCYRLEITVTSSNAQWVTTLRPIQNWCHFTDNIFKCIFMNEDVRILFKISLKVVPKGPVYNIPALVLIKACCRPGNTPLSEPMMVSLLTLICITRPPWVNILSALSLKDLTRSNRNSLWNWMILDRNNHDKGQDGEIHLIEWGLNKMAAPGRWQFLTFC